MSGTDIPHLSRHQFLLSGLLAYRALPSRVGTSFRIPALLSADQDVYAHQHGAVRTAGEQH